ncbi:hypothetical protein C0Q85_27380, partial [Klebsiella pneumoniae]|uniref:hypothetical protein n=2 Tax=Klebsiella pneumoniae TaxID=573 RepID=UPI000C7B9E14
SALCRCAAYGYAVHILFSHFSTADPKNTSSGSDSAPPARSGPETQDVAVFPAVSDHICCAPPLPRDRPLTTLKGRCGYSVCVVHFRKLWNNIKVGSGQSGRQVI